MKNLEGKVAIITGAGRGIGHAIAVEFGAAGAGVVVNYAHSEEEAQKTVDEIKSHGGHAIALRADIAKVGEIQKLFADSLQQLGRLDILVNNAGVEKNAPFWEVTEEDYDRVVDTNMKASFFATQMLVQHLREVRRPGKIINISSIHEDVAFPHFSPYCVSKGGLRMFTRDLAVELGPLGITINSIAPGAIRTDINQSLLDNPKQLQALQSKIPLGRLGETSDVSKLALYLAGSESDYVTGSTFYVDGGLSRQYQEQ